MTGYAPLPDTNPPVAIKMTIQVFSHSDQAMQTLPQQIASLISEHATITRDGQYWVADFANTDASLQAAIAMQQACDLFNFDNGSQSPILLGIHIACPDNSSTALSSPQTAFVRPGEIYLSESAYRTLHHDQAIKFRTVDHADTTAYKAIWKMQEFELAGPTHHQGAPSVGFFVKVILICLIPFLLVLAYTWREPLQHGLSSLDGTRTIDHQLE